MQTIAEYTDLKIPGYALSYLVNGDDSGIEEEDKKNIDDYMSRFYRMAEESNGHVIFAVQNEKDYTGEYITDDNGESVEQEGYFTWNPEFGLACTVFDCTILIVR